MQVGHCRPYVCVCVSAFSNISSETTGPIEAKFHMEPPWDGGMKICSNGPGHMTKMVAMSIYGKNLTSLLRNQRPITLKLGTLVRENYQVFSNDDPGMTVTYFTGRSIWSLKLLYSEKGKTMDFSETIVVYDLKLARDD